MSDETTSGEAMGLLDPADAASDRREVFDLWLRVQLALHLEPEAAARLVTRAAGDPRRVLAACGPSGRRAPELARSRAALETAGARLLALPAVGYPARLRAIVDPPAVLGVEGRAEVLDTGGVAIVGSRAATRYGLDVAHELARALAQRGVTIVSGMARGVDAAAHRGALEAGGWTIAVLACGLDRTYPPEHRRLRGEIAESGAVVSEMPPGVPPRAPYFPLRNRLISGLVDVVVVVEARERSGSLITVRHALVQGREVLALPGPIDAPTSAGPNRLLGEGAAPLLSVQDVLDRLPEGVARAPERVPKSAAECTDPAAGGDAGRLTALLARGPLDRDAACSALGWRPARLAVAVVSLTLAGRLVEDRDGRLHPRDGGGARPRRSG